MDPSPTTVTVLPASSVNDWKRRHSRRRCRRRPRRAAARTSAPNRARARRCSGRGRLTRSSPRRRARRARPAGGGRRRRRCTRTAAGSRRSPPPPRRYTSRRRRSPPPQVASVFVGRRGETDFAVGESSGEYLRVVGRRNTVCIVIEYRDIDGGHDPRDAAGRQSSRGVAVAGAGEPRRADGALSTHSPIRIGGDVLIRRRQAIPTPALTTPVPTPTARTAVSNPSAEVATATATPMTTGLPSPPRARCPRRG